MSQHHSKIDVKFVEHVASPIRGGSPRSILPNRLFTASVDNIKKNKESYNSKKVSQHSPSANLSIEEEVSDRTPQLEPADQTPERHLFDHLQDREEPSGAEADDFDDLNETPVMKREGYLETIRVQVTTEMFKEPQELSPVSSESEHFDNSPITNNQKKDEVNQGEASSSHEQSDSDEGGSTVSVQVSIKTSKRKSKKKKKREAEQSFDSSSNEHLSTPARDMRPESYKKISSRSREQSKSPKRRHHSYRSRERSKSPNSRLHSHRKKRQASPDDAKAANYPNESRSSSRNRRSQKKHHTSVDVDRASSSFSEGVKNVQLDSDLKESSDKTGSTSNYDDEHFTRNLSPANKEEYVKSASLKLRKHNLTEIAPLAKMSSSELYVEFETSCASDDEICDQQILTVHDRDLSKPSSFLSSKSESRNSKSSSALDYIPLDSPSPVTSGSLRPDTPYKLPSTPSSPYAPHGSPLHAWANVPPALTLSYYQNTPPPVPAPVMHQGTFQWSTSNVISPQSSPLLSRLPQLFDAPPPPPAVEKKYQRLQNLHNPPRPNFHGYQLIGDSMLLRFSQQMLGENAILAESLRFLGLCVSGQRIGELLQRLRSGFYHVGRKVVLMIGTNDLLRGTVLEQMCTELKRVVDILKDTAEQVIVLTLPPVPRLQHQTFHWARLNKYNDFIRRMGQQDSGILVFDISPLYVLSQEELEEQELLAEFNAEAPFCHGCLTCLEQDNDWDFSQSDEDDMGDTALFTRVFINTSPPVISPVDICNMFVDKRIPKCRIECFETVFSDNGRKDMIHLNKKGFEVVRDELYKAI